MNIRLTSQPLPAGFCALTDAQWQTLLSLVSTTITDTSGFLNVGIAPPDPDMRQYPWFRLEADGSPDREYFYWSGLWLSYHPSPPGFIGMYGGAVGNIPTYDGGEAAPAIATPTSGPMWVQYAALDGKFPLGCGTLPSGTVVGVGGTGGEETHVLTKGEMPTHSHYYLADQGLVELMQFQSGAHEIEPGNKTWLASPANKTQDAGNSVEHNNMPPYSGVYFIQRTARLFYRA